MCVFLYVPSDAVPFGVAICLACRLVGLADALPLLAPSRFLFGVSTMDSSGRVEARLLTVLDCRLIGDDSIFTSIVVSSGEIWICCLRLPVIWKHIVKIERENRRR